MGVAAMGSLALSGLSWSVLAASEPDLPPTPARKPLVVKPVFLYDLYTRHPQTSWRGWGGIEKQEDVDREIPNIQKDLDAWQAAADFPVKFLPLAALRSAKGLKDVADAKTADAFLVFAANGEVEGITAFGKPVVFFIRHKSGPLSLWYEIISPRYLRNHTDELKTVGITDDDVVVDNRDEVLWRLRGLCGLVNVMGSKILTIGGAGAWAQPGTVVPDLVKKLWKVEFEDVAYQNDKLPFDLTRLIRDARNDKNATNLAKKRAAEYLKLPGTTLECKLEFVENAFVLDQIFRKLMAKAGCRAMTINSCMGTIMPMSQTSACLALSTLNDDGYMAFCESDFVVIPSGMLCNGITGKPTFLNDPTYPHDGIITLAHCTGPRKMDGKTVEPVRLLTHFESDYGAAPKVEMRKGQITTNIAPDFKSQRWVGLRGEIVAAPFLPICRCQIDIKYTCPDKLLAERMPGFHWMTIYGDYVKEIGYALRRVPITWEVLC
jgi:hypothetical protein